jgi:acetyl-CoA C-acetyltransferase
MAFTREIYVVAAARTAIGTFGGALKDVPLTQLATTAVREALKRSGAEAATIGHVVMGNVIPTDTRDAYLARVAAVEAGIPHETPAMNVNRLCGSGLQAIVSAAQTILLGDADLAIGGGAESMSRGPVLHERRALGRPDGRPAGDRLHARHPARPVPRDPHGHHRRERRRARRHHARDAGRARGREPEARREGDRRGPFQVADRPGRDQDRKGTVVFDTDEHVRGDTTIEQLAKMKPAFKPDGSVTAGNASGLNDGAAAVVLASGDALKSSSLKPIARLVAYAHAGVDPKLMGLGPVPASRAVLKRAGLSAKDLDVIESNEAFAAQACAVTRALELDPAKVNPNGSGISLGHPVGATGAIITTKALYELQRVNGRYALVTMCIGGGQGIAAIFERS